MERIIRKIIKKGKILKKKIVLINKMEIIISWKYQNTVIIIWKIIIIMLIKILRIIIIWKYKMLLIKVNQNLKQ